MARRGRNDRGRREALALPWRAGRLTAGVVGTIWPVRGNAHRRRAPGADRRVFPVQATRAAGPWLCLATGERRPRSSQPRSTLLPSWTVTRAGTPMPRSLASSGSRPPRRQGSCWTPGGRARTRPRRRCTPARRTASRCSAAWSVMTTSRRKATSPGAAARLGPVVLRPRGPARRSGDVRPGSRGKQEDGSRLRRHRSPHREGRGRADRAEPGCVRAGPAATGGDGPHHRQRRRRCLADQRREQRG